jgi:hypothetical protein
MALQANEPHGLLFCRLLSLVSIEDIWCVFLDSCGGQHKHSTNSDMISPHGFEHTIALFERQKTVHVSQSSELQSACVPLSVTTEFKDTCHKCNPVITAYYCKVHPRTGHLGPEGE